MTENTAKKPREHKLTEKHPIIAALLFAYVLLIVIQMIQILVNLPINLVLSWYPRDMGAIGAIVGAALILFGYRLFFKPEYEGSLRGGSPATGFRLGIAHFVMLLLSGVITMAGTAVTPHMATFNQLNACFMAGICEETAFRGLLIATLMRQWRRDEKKLLPAAIISGLSFGLVHLLNIGSGADVLRTFSQTIQSACVGFFFAAVVLRSGNILPVMVLHTLQNFISCCTSAETKDDMVIRAAMQWYNYVDIALTIGLAVFGVYLLRSAKRSEITEVWDKKWSNELTAA